MPHYVMLNFEDEDPTAGPGVAKGIKGKDIDKFKSIGSAAAGTAKIYAKRALAKSSFFKSKEVVFYSCREILDRHKAKTLAEADLAKIRQDCKSAKTIAIIIHGTPTDTDRGFGTDGKALCTWAELGELILLMFPANGKYNVALVMCYAARSQDASLDHRGQIPQSELKSSFAYKFFKQICDKRVIRMTARTGAVSNDNDINHTVETEEQVFAVLERQQAMQLRALNKSDFDDRKKEFFKRENITEKEFQDAMLKFANNPNAPPKGKLEKFAKEYIIYSPMVSMYVNNKFDSAKLGNRSKYGKMLYTYDGAFLEIVARYQTDDHGPNYSLYKGPLL